MIVFLIGRGADHNKRFPSAIIQPQYYHAASNNLREHLFDVPGDFKKNWSPKCSMISLFIYCGHKAISRLVKLARQGHLLFIHFSAADSNSHVGEGLGRGVGTGLADWLQSRRLNMQSTI